MRAVATGLLDYPASHHSAHGSSHHSTQSTEGQPVSGFQFIKLTVANILIKLYSSLIN
jgi:hypothetical protein